MIVPSQERKTAQALCSALLAATAACAGSQPEPQQPAYQQYPPVGPGAAQQAPGQAAPGYPTQQQAGYPAQQQQPGYPAQQQYPQQQPYPAQPAPAQPTAPMPAPAATQPAPPPQQAPATALPPTATAGPQALPVDPAAAAALQPLITQAATTAIPAGAQPLGALMAANFQQGQQLSAQIQMEPGRCYTVLAAGTPPTVTELDLQLVALSPMPGTAPVLAVDNSSGPTAILGQKPNCYKWAWPIPAPVQVIMTVRGGSGLAAAQVFAK